MQPHIYFFFKMGRICLSKFQTSMDYFVPFQYLRFQDDERFWAKIPVIREKKKRGGSQKETPSSAPIKKKK